MNQISLTSEHDTSWEDVDDSCLENIKLLKATYSKLFNQQGETCKTLLLRLFENIEFIVQREFTDYKKLDTKYKNMVRQCQLYEKIFKQRNCQWSFLNDESCDTYADHSLTMITPFHAQAAAPDLLQSTTAIGTYRNRHPKRSTLFVSHLSNSKYASTPTSVKKHQESLLAPVASVEQGTTKISPIFDNDIFNQTNSFFATSSVGIQCTLYKDDVDCSIDVIPRMNREQTDDIRNDTLENVLVENRRDQSIQYEIMQETMIEQYCQTSQNIGKVSVDNQTQYDSELFIEPCQICIERRQNFTQTIEQETQYVILASSCLVQTDNIESSSTGIQCTLCKDDVDCSINVIPRMDRAQTDDIRNDTLENVLVENRRDQSIQYEIMQETMIEQYCQTSQDIDKIFVDNQTQSDGELFMEPCQICIERRLNFTETVEQETQYVIFTSSRLIQTDCKQNQDSCSQTPCFEMIHEHTQATIIQQDVGLQTSLIDQTEQMCDKDIQTDQTAVLSTVYDSVIHSSFPAYSSTIYLTLPSYRDCVDEAIQCTDPSILETSSSKRLSSILLLPLTSNRLPPPPSSRRSNRLSDIDNIKNTSMQTEQETDTSLDERQRLAQDIARLRESNEKKDETIQWWIESSTNAKIKCKELTKQIQLLSKNRRQTETNLLDVLEQLTLVWKIMCCENETDDGDKENSWPLPPVGECLKTPINGRLLSNQSMFDENIDESSLITRINSLCQLIVERFQVDNKWHMDYEKGICDNNKLCNDDNNQIKLIPLDIDHYNDELTMLNNQLDKEQNAKYELIQKLDKATQLIEQMMCDHKSEKNELELLLMGKDEQITKLVSKDIGHANKEYDILQQLNNEKEKELNKITEEYAMLYYEYEAERRRNIDLSEAKDRLCDHIKTLSDELGDKEVKQEKLTIKSGQQHKLIHYMLPKIDCTPTPKKV
ncbi:unnamed protein product [Didymodactylos carnosus]|uniref:Uncharacterized protein n=1 Tax=Didymodactylos carnosus TaxID=1234261 RepID=A0A8S2CL55_9BILA|nr:unnamed protein product [Didymodactylos carnosus]CAF3508502.1 unnamed protein product [Didymodactylos carnosus]